MTKINLKIATFIAMLFIGKESMAQLSFSVYPGTFLNSATFGCQKEKWVPFVGLQVLSGMGSLTEEGKRFDANANSVIDYEDKIMLKGTGFIPTIGTKYFFKEQNKLKAYGIASISRAFIGGKGEDSDDPTFNTDMKKIIKGLSAFGFQLGFGTEYFIDKSFSIGGEFGFRFMRFKSKQEDDRTIFDPNSGSNINTTVVNTAKLRLNPTYASISLNFYFDKQN